jgi:hypothetical protein
MRAMIAAIAAPTVNTTQNNAMTENGIMAFTATSFPGRGASGRGLTGYVVGLASLVAGNVACRAPVTRQRLGHADQVTALTLPDHGWRLRARSP